MSKPHDEHQSPIKTPKQLIAVVVASFIVPVVLIILLVNWVTGAKNPAAGTDAQSEKAVSQRIAPIAKLDFKDPNAVKVLKTGEQVYQAACTACHSAGAAGAPKSGDVAAWAPRIKQGLDGLVKSVIGGKGAMPARAGNPDLDDVEIARAVVYMANGSGAKFAEPATPAAPVASAAVTTAAAPAAAVAAVAAAPVATSSGALAKIYFDSGKAALPADGKALIAKAADYLKANAGAALDVSGFVDGKGNAAQNAELAKQRAFAVRDALKAAGVAEGKINLKKPEVVTAAAGDDKEARRVEINVAGTAASAAVAPQAAAGAVAATAAVAAAAAPAAASAPDLAAGKKIYDGVCMACHAAGVAGAPKFGDKAAWAPRGTNLDALAASVIKGKGAMPAKGGSAASDAEIKSAVAYILSAAK